MSTFDLVPFEADEESEGINALKRDESAETSDDEEVGWFFVLSFGLYFKIFVLVALF